MTDFADRLSAAMTRIAGPGAITDLVRLSGGANMESWSFDWGGAGHVLRRAPSAAFMADRPFGHDTEAALVRAVHAAGIAAPHVVGDLVDGDGLGTGYVMWRIMGETAPARILADPPPRLIDGIARELAAIHRLPVDVVPAGIPPLDPRQGIAGLRAQFMAYGGDRPICALALTWLDTHVPAPVRPCLVHGDYRMGNLMVDDRGLAAVLDWELAHLGDPHEDLAYGCMTVWRFGAIDRAAFGIADLASWFDAYRAAGGEAVDPARFRFWLIYRTLWWALGCLAMGAAWRGGVDATLERAVIARRASENELDLLLLLEHDVDDPVRDAARVPAAVAGQPAPRPGETNAGELVAAVADWLAHSVKPGATGHARFEVAVALNALGIVRRDLSAGVVVEDAALARQLLDGTATLSTPGILAALRRQALAKAAVDSPKYAALTVARAAWEH